jgi:hypothetical protein
MIVLPLIQASRQKNLCAFASWRETFSDNPPPTTYPIRYIKNPKTWKNRKSLDKKSTSRSLAKTGHWPPTTSHCTPPPGKNSPQKSP